MVKPPADGREADAYGISPASSGSEIDGFAAEQAVAADENENRLARAGGMRQPVNENSAARLGSAGLFVAARPAAPGAPVFEKSMRRRQRDLWVSK